MTRTVYRYTIPVDDEWTILRLSGPIVHVAARCPDVVEVWALCHVGADLRQIGPETRRTFRVFGTGHSLPDADSTTKIVHVGSALVGALVWHLFELVALDGSPYPGSVEDEDQEKSSTRTIDFAGQTPGGTTCRAGCSCAGGLGYCSRDL